MRPRYTLWTVLCLCASVPLAAFLLQRRSAQSGVPVVRFATYNAALFRAEPGQLLAELRGGGSAAARQIAEVIQRGEVDVLLLCELDRDEAAATAAVFAEQYLAVGQNGATPIDFAFRFAGPVNTGEPSGRDLDGDGKVEGPGDAFGYGRFPGQYGMAVLSRHPLLLDRVRTFQRLPWAAMPGALRPDGVDDATWAALRLSSKSHWDVPVGIGPVDRAMVVHLLCSHPTPPVFDGPEDRNGRRNHDEIRFWSDYLTPGQGEWIVDDQGGRGGLAADARCVLLGDLNCDPIDGDGRREAIAALLAHPRLQDPLPRSEGAVEAARQQWGQNTAHRGDAALDTGDFPDKPGEGPGNLRLDYALVDRRFGVHGTGVHWPLGWEPAAKAAAASDHRLVWVDVEVR